MHFANLALVAIVATLTSAAPAATTGGHSTNSTESFNHPVQAHEARYVLNYMIAHGQINATMVNGEKVYEMTPEQGGAAKAKMPAGSFPNITSSSTNSLSRRASHSTTVDGDSAEADCYTSGDNAIVTTLSNYVTTACTNLLASTPQGQVISGSWWL